MLLGEGLSGSTTGSGDTWGELVLQGGELAAVHVRDVEVGVDTSWEPVSTDCAVSSWRLSMDYDASLAAPSGGLTGLGTSGEFDCAALLATWAVAD